MIVEERCIFPFFTTITHVHGGAVTRLFAIFRQPCKYYHTHTELACRGAATWYCTRY